MKMQFVVDQALAGKSIKQYFEQQGYSTTQIKRYKYDGHILVNGKAVTVRYVFQLGDQVDIATNTRLKTPVFAQNKAQIVYQDEFLYVAYKPYGVAIHPDLAHPTETFGNMLSATFGNGFELRLITRLDKTTKGLVLGALDEITAQKLNHLQISHQLEKTYVATVQGHIEGQGQIDLPLARDGNKTIVCANGKNALSFYKKIAFDGKNTLVELKLGTGRTHQLRAHLSAIGHPIVGDRLYGAMDDGQIQLTCIALRFTHPHTKAIVDVVLPKKLW